jgi:endoglucanase
MTPDSLSFLKSLLDTPGPSAFETAPARVWRAEAERFADAVRADVAGNSVATLNGGGRPRVMFAGHIDEIGVMVSHVDDDGFISFDTIGGWDHQVFVGQRVHLLGRGGAVAGVVGKKAIHLIDKDDREKASKVEDLWIDIGATSKAEAERRIRIGGWSAAPSTIASAPSWCSRRSGCSRPARARAPRRPPWPRPARRSRLPAAARARRRRCSSPTWRS